MRTKLFLFLFFLYSSLFLSAQVSVSKVFSNHMVLQRGIDIPIWGSANAGVEITVGLGDVRSTARANKQGKWMVHLPEFKAGGPYNLSIYATSNPEHRIEFSDVLIGDVWLASGQSNMELQVQQANDAEKEIKAANYPDIRFFNVPPVKSLKPESNLSGGAWVVCDSGSVKTISAVAYYFARKIHADIHVPVGILQTTWGGSPVEAWTSREMLLSSPVTRQRVLDDDSLTMNHFIKDSLDLITFWDIVYHPKNKMDKIVPLNKFDDSKWPEFTMPKVFKDWGMPFYEGMVWLRKTVVIPKSFKGKILHLNLGHPEMNYSLYFNGQEICKTVWNANPTHEYTIPVKMVKQGKNVIAVRMAVLWGGGGFNPPADQMLLTDGSTKISLAGNWKYMKDMEPKIPKINNYQYYPTYLYNAMVNPVIPYGIKGFIWYQGEANDSMAYKYRTMFPMLITDWRIRWMQGYLPFLYVQLPNYMQIRSEPSESQWAELREAQAMTLAQPNTGMACTIDVGEANTIHPKNKQEVGRRLALVAEHLVYKRGIVASGPTFRDFKIEGNQVRIRFSETGSGLTTRDNQPLRGFAIAGSDKKFYWATARIEGNEVIVSSDKVLNPVAVRYAWADNPVCNLINKEGLPAVPFRTDQWKGITEK
jgi:sialate O-acetylesterase